ncbi:MAG TPA: hypothetical protein PLW65_06415 [Pseudomonadota bacterium]|nr:hypothetical protein [Pseudomonadota bacterium]
MVGVVELGSRGDRVARMLAAQGLTAPALTLLSDARAHDEAYILGELRRLHERAPFDAMLLACDPRQRAAYFTFACQTGTSIFVDKPVFARDGLAQDEAAGAEYVKDLVTLAERARAAGIDFVVQAQRRDHAGYRFVRATVQACLARFGVPVTSLHIQHADGMWVLPSEWERDHHPYKFGFGKLLHSGYHFIDLLAFLLDPTLRDFRVSSVEVAAKATFPSDSLAVWEGHPLLPPDKRCAPALDRSTYGEHDTLALLDFKNEAHTVCVAELALLQNSLSDRDPAVTVTNPYKGIGRVRHERVDLKLASLLNIQVHSYQSRSTREPAGAGVGEVDHFDILLFRNKHFFSEPAFEKLTLADLDPAAAVAHNEHARGSLLKRFLRREASQSELCSHLLTGMLVGLIYEAMAKSRGGIGLARSALDRALLF